MDGIPGSIDPAQAATIYANFIVINLYDTLYRYKYLARPYQLQPNLAAAMPEVSEDGLRVTIRIKKGVYFIDDPVMGGRVKGGTVDFLLRHPNTMGKAMGAKWDGDDLVWGRALQKNLKSI